MGIVIELQQQALSQDTDILNLLRKAYLVARKLKLEQFEEWISHELNGYDIDDDIPKYRVYHGEIKAWNPYHGWVPVIFDGKSDLSTYEAHDPIANLIDVYNNSNDNKNARVMFDDEMNALLSKSAPFPTKYCLNISISLLFSTFESIRNTILDWAITLEEDGIIGEGLRFTEEEVQKASESATINNFSNIFYGDVNGTQVQQGSDKSSQDRK